MRARRQCLLSTVLSVVCLWKCWQMCLVRCENVVCVFGLLTRASGRKRCLVAHFLCLCVLVNTSSSPMPSQHSSLTDLESQEEDSPRRILFFKPMSCHGLFRTHRRLGVIIGRDATFECSGGGIMVRLKKNTWFMSFICEDKKLSRELQGRG
jgi:hypothetical protein